MKLRIIIPTLFSIAAASLAGEKEKAFEESFLDAISTSDEAMKQLVECSRSTPKLFRDMIIQSLKEDRQKKNQSYLIF